MADLLRESGAAPLSPVELGQLRTGQRDDPDRRHLDALAALFGVPAAYFCDDGTAERVTAELALVSALRAGGVQRVGVRAAGRSPRSTAQVLATVGQLRAQEGLQAGPADRGTDRTP